MSKNVNLSDERGEIVIRFRLDNDKHVRFIDPCCDEIPVDLFLMVTQAFSEIQKKWNSEIDKSKND